MQRPTLSLLLAGPAVALLVTMAASCGTGIGGICQSSEECGGGLECLPFCGVSDNGKICTVPCKTDADCAGEGSNIICFVDCGAASVCFPDSACAGGSCDE